jgi:hypothetical protein
VSVLNGQCPHCADGYAVPCCIALCCAVLQEASAARARLVCLRSRLGELRGLNADRQQRATELQERLAETEVGRRRYRFLLWQFGRALFNPMVLRPVEGCHASTTRHSKGAEHHSTQTGSSGRLNCAWLKLRCVLRTGNPGVNFICSTRPKEVCGIIGCGLIPFVGVSMSLQG